MAQAQQKEQELREMAKKVKEEKTALLAEEINESSDDSFKKRARKERDTVKAERRREIVREDRMQRAGFKRTADERDGERDISEKIALGQAQPSDKEAMYD